MEPDGSTSSGSDVPEASNDITTVSPPQSSPDIFHTPPRYMSPSNSPSFYDCNDDGITGVGGLDHDGEIGNVGTKRAVDLAKDVEVDSPKRLKTDSDSDGTFHMESEGIMGNTEAENNSIKEKSLDVSTEGIQFDDANMKVECENADCEGNTNVVEDIDSAGNCSDSCGMEDGTEKTVLLPSLDQEANSGTEDEGLLQIPLSEGIVDIETPMAMGPKEENMETKKSSIEVGIKGQSWDYSTEGIECDTEIRKLECKNDNDEGKSEKFFNIIEDIDCVGSGSNSCEEKTKGNNVLPSLVDEDPEANSRVGDEGFKQILFSEEIIGTDLPSELLGSGPKEGNTETENYNNGVSIMGTCLEFSTEGIDCDTENRKVECKNDNAEASYEKNSNIVEDTGSAGNGSNSCGSEEEKIKKNGVLPSLADAHPEANSKARDEGLKQILFVEQFMDIESPSEPLSIGPEEGNAETENNNIEVSIMGKSLDVSTEGIECDIENRKVESANDIGEGNSEINRDIVEEIDAAGNGSNSCGSEEEKTKKNGVLPSLDDAHPEANNRVGDEALKKIPPVEGFMDVESPNEPLGVGPEKGNAETENVKGKSLHVSTEGIGCDTENRKAECESDIGEGNYEINANIVDKIDPAGNVSISFGTEEEKTKKTRVFPSLPDEHPEVNNIAGDEGVQRILLSEVLRKLAKNEPEEDWLAGLSLLEVAERRWGPF